MAILIVTSEKSGVDRYSQEKAHRLSTNRIETRRYPSLSQAYQLAKLIGSQDDVVHLTTQDFARYAVFAEG